MNLLPTDPYLRSLPLLALVLVIYACRPGDTEQQRSGGVTETVEFEHKAEAEYAEGFRISYHENYKLLEIFSPFQNRVDTLRYALVPGSLAGQADIENAWEIEIPVESAIVTSTTHVALTEVLDAHDIIDGIVGAEYVYNEEIRNRLEAGEITTFSEGEFNKEQALALSPDLIMISGGQSSQFDDYQILMDSGIDVLVNSEWLETTPLGKAEWVKVMAVLLNREEAANNHFSEVKEHYEELKKKAEGAREKPSVLINQPYKGAWFVPGGESFTAQLLEDAGADYPWSESEGTGGLRMNFESVYEVGLEADIWVNPGAAETQKEILAKDSRFRDFKSFRNGEIYNHYKRTRPSGGNDFWESGVVRPDIVLADLISIFHPDLLPGHPLYYYIKVD